MMAPDSLASVTVTSTSRVDIRLGDRRPRHCHLVDVVFVGVVRGFVVWRRTECQFAVLVDGEACCVRACDAPCHAVAVRVSDGVGGDGGGAVLWVIRWTLGR